MFLTREQVRSVDRRAVEEYAAPSIILMENAGRGAAELLMRLGVHGTVCICCGKGNNGGDGFTIARHLDNHLVPVKVLLFGQPDELSGDAATNYQIAQKSGIAIKAIPKDDITTARVTAEFTGCEWLVDALFGTGLSGAIRAPYDQIVEAINQSGLRVLAVDIPSGLDCDEGKPMGAAVRAAHTATFVAEKKGFAHPEAREWTGQVHVIGIGAPRRCVENMNR